MEADRVQGDEWVEAIGLVVSYEGQAVNGRLVCDDRHLDWRGRVHSGVFQTVVETLASHAAARAELASGTRVVGTNNSTVVFRQVRDGVLLGTVTRIHVDQHQHFWQVDVHCEGEDALVARGTVRLQRFDQVGA